MAKAKKQTVNQTEITEVQCHVSNCVYNNHKSHCTANTICVGPHMANASSDTVCQSFHQQ